MSCAKDIIKKASKDIIYHIRYEVGLIYRAVNARKSDDEEPYTSEEDWPYSPSVEVETDNSYLDIYDYTYEPRKVVKVSFFGEGIIVETEEGDELFGNNISIDELASISDCLDLAYKKLTHKK